jgi:broad specificity phosphatase PhoE
MGLSAADAELLSALKAAGLFKGNRFHVTAFSHRLIFVRHGETAYNAENRLQGQLDIPLNARGREQARAVGRTLSARIRSEIDRLEAAAAFIASPLERARETMEIARDAIGLPPQAYRLDAALKELTFGAWEGLTWSEIEARDVYAVRERRKDKWRFTPPGGESYATLAARVGPWLDGLTGDAFIVSHGGVARALMALIAGVPPAKAADAPIMQGRALCFENGSCNWIT